MFTVTGSPALAFADAIALALTSDATLMAMVTGVYAALPRAGRTLVPYIVLGKRESDDTGGAMQIAGGLSKIFLEVWSNLNGPAQVQQIQGRIRSLLLRRTLLVSGYTMLANSLTCPMESVALDPDPDMPENTLFHGEQEWTAWLEEAA